RREVLGQQIALLGYDLEADRVRAGEPVKLTLYWQAKAKLVRNYTVFVQILDEAGKVVAQQDNEPNGGKFPTSAWPVGQVVRDQYAVSMPATVAPGKHGIVVGMYEW